MRGAVAAFLTLCLCLPAQAGQFSQLIAAAAAATKPNGPTPNPQPSGKCDNCDGVGKVGDGIIMTVCPVCNGTGKKTLQDGQLSPRGEWRWSKANRKWMPVPKSSDFNAQLRGHWETRTVCNGKSCESIRVFVSN